MNRRLMRTYLIDLIKLGGGERLIRAPTTFLAIVFGVSQQTASRIINELCSNEYVYKTMKNGNLWVRVTEKGLAEVEEYIKYINDAYKHPGKVILMGYVTKGLGEGAYYISKRRYQIQFKDILGFYPYPGTLNIQLKDPYYISQNRFLRSLPGYRIKGFRTRDRYFGGAKVFKATIQGRVYGGVVYADRSIYGFDIVEVVAEQYLREHLGLKDGDEITIEISINQ